MWPFEISSPRSAACVGRPVTRSMWLEMTPVNSGGMWRTMKTGTASIAGTRLFKTMDRACGPPVEAPMTITRGPGSGSRPTPKSGAGDANRNVALVWSRGTESNFDMDADKPRGNATGRRPDSDEADLFEFGLQDLLVER